MAENLNATLPFCQWNLHDEGQPFSETAGWLVLIRTCYFTFIQSAHVAFSMRKKWSGQNPTSPTACYGHAYWPLSLSATISIQTNRPALWNNETTALAQLHICLLHMNSLKAYFLERHSTTLVMLKSGTIWEMCFCNFTSFDLGESEATCSKNDNTTMTFTTTVVYSTESGNMTASTLIHMFQERAASTSTVISVGSQTAIVNHC